MAKMRIDQLLVHRGLVENPSKARARIMAGDVIVNDHRVDKAGLKFGEDVNIRLRGAAHSFVSRGGVKLEYALKRWPFDISAAICLDVGASTGGFSEVLLEHGASKIYAVDVGYGQLAEKLRIDARVINLERTHILHLQPSSLKEQPAVAVVDVSFISLEKVLGHVASLLSPRAFLYVLIKPQFEAGREHIEKGGIVKNEAIRWMCVDKIARLIADLDFRILGVAPSPIVGAKGNIEFVLAALREPLRRGGQLAD